MRLYLFSLLIPFLHVFAKESETFYLIPKTQKSCLPRDKRGPFRMSSDKISLLRPVSGADGKVTYSKVLAFPGCFELSAQLEVVERTKTKSVIMYHSFKWLQALSNADVSSLDVGCSGADAYGCGGRGNRCYYCDICETLKEQNDKLSPEERFKADCPSEPGRVYDYYEERCINDWGSLDKDKDGTPDFMKEDKYKDYAKFLDDMKIEGYGTMRLTVYLATNATGSQLVEMESHRSTLIDKLKKQGLSPAKAEEQWAKVHKVYWLPKLVSENLIACVNVFFDMCKYNLIEDPKQLDVFQCPTKN